MLGEKKLINSLHLKNILSFGKDAFTLPLNSLNVLIGPNSSGKSNVIDVIDVLRSTPNNLTQPIMDGGGILHWLWKGDSTSGQPVVAEINATISYPKQEIAIRHRLNFSVVSQQFNLVDEVIENEHLVANDSEPFFYYRFQQGHPVLHGIDSTGKSSKRNLRREDVRFDSSILSQREDPDIYPEITFLRRQYSQVRLYREWSLGRHTPLRLAQRPDSPADFLDENATNLALVLNRIEHQYPMAWRNILSYLEKFSPAFKDISTSLSGGTVELFLHEQSHQNIMLIPASRFSDGTLRFLCLLAILCHPAPPPLICIEEPETSLHPDIMSVLADLLIDASHRTQMIVTTHSEALIDALTHEPESVIVCEKHDGATQMKRLSEEDLKIWLEKYSLGELWRRGEIGGTRW